MQIYLLYSYLLWSREVNSLSVKNRKTMKEGKKYLPIGCYSVTIIVSKEILIMGVSSPYVPK